MRIFVDSDACPVKEEIMKIAQAEKVMAYFVSSTRNFFVVKEGAVYYQWVLADQGKEALELYIANQINAGDIVITHDYGLASMVLGKKGYVMTPRGRRIDQDNIEFLLFRKHVHSKVFRTFCKLNGSKSLHEEDRLLFSLKLLELINCSQKEGY